MARVNVMRRTNSMIAALLSGLTFLCSVSYPQEQKGKAQFDRYGDPLPANVINRLGTTRFRHVGRCSLVAFCPDGKRLLSLGRDQGRDRILRCWDASTG